MPYFFMLYLNDFEWVKVAKYCSLLEVIRITDKESEFATAALQIRGTLLREKTASLCFFNLFHCEVFNPTLDQ